MILESENVKKFRQKLIELSREELLEIIKIQDPQYIKHIERIEYVFKYKMNHLTWNDGSPVNGMQFTNEQLALLIDPPFMFDRELAKHGLNEEAQRHIHLASDPILWAKHFLKDPPRAYQTLVLRDPSMRKVMRFGRRLGKALALDTPIPTPNGWTTMGDLKVGDQVFDENGNKTLVMFATETMYDHECYKIKFNDGSSIIADKDHQWTVETKKIRKNNARNKTKSLPLITLTTGEMLETLNVGDKDESNYSIPLASPLKYVEENSQLSIHPYVFGYWLGDGSRRDATITIGPEDKEESIKNIESCGYPIINRNNDMTFGIKFLHKQLRLRGLFDGPEKFIPREFLEASIEQRLDLLRGLMDSDGSVTTREGALEFCSSYETLANQVYELITSLGIKAHIYECESWLNGVRHRNRFRIYFKTAVPVFKLTRKLKNQIIEDLPCQQRRYIIEISKVESVPVRCITVDSPNSLFLAGKTCIPTHNSRTMAYFALWYAYTNTKGRIIIVAPMKSHVGLIYDEILSLAKQNDIILNKEEKSCAITRHVMSPQYQIDFDNQSTIKFFTTGMKSNNRADVVRGQEADVLILDEMDYMGKDDLIALLAMMQRTNENKTAEKQMIAASTPTGQRNKFWEWNVKPDDGFKSFWLPSYVNPNWDQVTEDQMRKDYPNEQAYRHEIEADWGEDVEGVYPHKFVKAAFLDPGWAYRPQIHSDKAYFVFGVDWDKWGAGVNIVVLEICKDDYPIEEYAGKIRLIYREEVRKGDYTYTASVDRIIELNRIFRPRHIYVDKGSGDTQIELLHKYGIENQQSNLHKIVKGYQFAETTEIRDPYTKEIIKKRLKVFMVDNLYRMLEDQRILFSYEDEELYTNLLGYVVLRTSITTGDPVFAAGGNTTDHAHDALILACFAVADNYDELFNMKFESVSKAISGDFFMPTFEVSTNKEKEIAEDKWGKDKGPVHINRSLSYNIRGSGHRSGITRKMF
jgi:hypothetical protein